MHNFYFFFLKPTDLDPTDLGLVFGILKIDVNPEFTSRLRKLSSSASPIPGTRRYIYVVGISSTVFGWDGIYIYIYIYNGYETFFYAQGDVAKTLSNGISWIFNIGIIMYNLSFSNTSNNNN